MCLMAHVGITLFNICLLIDTLCCCFCVLIVCCLLVVDLGLLAVQWTGNILWNVDMQILVNEGTWQKQHVGF